MGLCRGVFSCSLRCCFLLLEHLSQWHLLRTGVFPFPVSYSGPAGLLPEELVTLSLPAAEHYEVHSLLLGTSGEGFLKQAVGAGSGSHFSSVHGTRMFLRKKGV